ncbi:MAG: aminopeptidase P family protein [Mycoplasmoidaceae bacterium]|nr:aminopeptidase P family protein [Mycoplasmoidaceae bacterium]
MFEEDYVSYSDFNNVLKKLNVKLIPASTKVLRASKTQEEISYIKKSMNIAVEAINFIKKHIKVGMTELEVKQLLTIYMLAAGASATSFDLIVAFGEHTANPHHVSTNRKLKSNEFITCDIGCIYNGYCSDITRTFWLGKPSKKMLEMYNLVLEANKLGIKNAKVGVTGRFLDGVCRSYIAKSKEYGDLFVHGTGHGVGIEIHELPDVKFIYNNKILNNSIITIEPGVYQPGFGGVRIEDSILVTNKGVEVLTKKAKK